MPDQWIPALGAAATPRTGGCVVLMRDGSALFAGGESSSASLGSSDLLDRNGNFRPAANMLWPHSSAACALLPDGRVLVAGGRVAGGFSNATEIYDAAANEWSAGPPMLQGRAGASVTILHDGLVLLAGGETAAGPSDSLEIYDPRRGAFLPVPARLPSPVSRHASALLPDGRVLIAGGWNGSRALDAAEVFDPVTGSITEAGRLAAPRAGLSATTLLDGRVFVAGGSNGQAEVAAAEIFDPQTGQWEAAGAGMAAPRRDHTAILVPDNNTVLFIGGTAAGPQDPAAVSQTEVYIPWRREFRSIGALPMPVTGGLAVALAQFGRVAVAGGRASGAQAAAATISLPAIRAGRPDYRPGDMVRLSGSGWAPGQTVRVSFPQDSHGDQRASVTATADMFGNWAASWMMPDTGGRGLTVYPTATQTYVNASGRTEILTGRTAVTSIVAALRISASCTGNGGFTYSFGTSVCATVVILDPQAAGEQFAWVAPTGIIYAAGAAASAGAASDTETPNAGGTWTVKAYPTGSCTTSSGKTTCAGTPDAQGAFYVGAGKLAFATAGATFPSGGCSPAMAVQIQAANGTAVSPTLPTAVALSSSSSLGRFFATPACSGAVGSITIPAGASSAAFYYSDQAATATVTASANSLTAASQTEKTTAMSPSLSMTFGGPTLALNATTALTFTVGNPSTNSATLAGIAINDNLPAQIAVATPNGFTGACSGGTITAAPGSGSVSLSGASLAPNTSCVFAVNVRGRSAGTAYDSAVASSSNGGSSAPATANIAVVEPPSIAAAFGAQNVGLNASTPLTYTITNPGANTVAISGVSFTDTLPSGLIVATPSGVTGNCAGTVSAAAGSSAIALSGATAAVNSSCTFAVNVTATTNGAKTNSVTVNSDTGGPGNTASTTLNVAVPPSVVANFGSATVPLNGGTSLSFTITNPNSALAVSGVAIADPLPAGLAIATPNGLAGGCGGSVSAAAGTANISLTGGTLAAGASCTFAVNVTASAAGLLSNTTGAVTSLQGGAGNPASAILRVVAPPVLSLAFGAPSLAVNGTTSLTFTITNPAVNSLALSGVAFTDVLPAGLAVAATPGVAGSCGGAVAASAGSRSISLTNGGLPQNGSCSVAVNVTATAAGTLTDSVQVTSGNGGAGNTASTTLQPQAPAQATRLAISAPASAKAGKAFNYTVTALDGSNNIVPSYSGSIQFASSDPQGTLPAVSKLANGSGTFAATLDTAGTVTISAADSVTASISGTATVAVGAGAPSAIVAVGGTPQFATVNAKFASPLQAAVRDAFGNAVSGASVTFAAPAAGASAILTNSTVSTNANGIASVTATANAVSGSYTVSVNIASATAAFVLTNMAVAVAANPSASSLQLAGAVAGTYSVPNAGPYSSLGSFYFDLRVSNWGRLSGNCATLVQFVTSPQYGPSRIQLCDPAYGWGAINVGEFIDGTSGGSPVWMQAPNIAIVAATAANPMVVTLASAPFPAPMAVGRTITIVNAAGAGCAGMNSNQVITAVSGNQLTLQYDGTGCSYNANSGIALSQDFVVRYHRDLAANQLIGEVWNVDGTGHSSKALGILNSASISLPMTLQIGAPGVTANLAYLRWYSGTIPVGAPAPSGSSGGDLGDWEFDGNGNDASGHNLNISFASAPAYVTSPSYPPACSAGASQSFRAGQSASLDATGSFPLDGGSTLTYSWTQIPNALTGASLPSLTWSSNTVAQPTISGFGFGPMNFQLTVTQGDGQTSTCTVHDGAVQTDSSGVVTTATGNSALDSAVKTLIGPQMQLGQNPWPFYDQAAIADAAVQIADMDVHYLDYWDTPDVGTVSVSTGSHTVTGSGTTFTTTFCQGPTNPTVPRNGATIIVWYPTGRTVNGARETGRRRMTVNSCGSDTQLNASLPSNGTAWVSDAPDGSGLSYTAEFYNHLWEYGGAPANYYDNVQAYYALYYRSGIDTYLAAARKLADRFWTSPEIDRGLAFNVGDWFGAQSGRANSISGLVLRALDTFDGHPDMWAGLHNVWSYTDWLLTGAYPNWSASGGIDGREYGYTLAQAAYGALWDPDPTWQAYCQSMIKSTFQTDSTGIWPKNLDSVQQGWLQWFEMKSTFDGGQTWSGSTVTLTNGSNLVACAGGNCGWQASDFAAYDLNSGSACSGGATCGTTPVLFTDSAVFPADSSHTDSASYCYPNTCTFVDSNHFTLDRAYTGTSGTHGWVFGVSNGSLGATNSGVVGWGGLPYMEGILGWAFDLAGKGMACAASGGPGACDNTTSSLAYSYSAMAAKWITTYGLMPQYYGAAYFGGYPACSAPVDPGNLWCNKGDNVLQSRELMGDAYRGLAAVYRRSPTQALKTTLDNWFAGMWAKPGTNPLIASPDGQYDTTFDPTGCAGCGFFLTDGAPYSQKFFGQHFGISNEGGWPAIRLGY